MNKDDRQLDRLLAAVYRRETTAAPDGCLDADTLAAWMDGQLAGPALTRAEAHAAACARCQAMLAAAARTAAAETDARPAPVRSWFRRALPWAAPLTAAATAAALYVAIRPAAVQENLAPNAVQSEPAPAIRTAPDTADREDAAAPPPSEARSRERAATPTAEPPTRRTEAAAVRREVPEPAQDASKTLADTAPAVPVPSAPPPPVPPPAPKAEPGRPAETQTTQVRATKPPAAFGSRAAAQAPPALAEALLPAPPVLLATADPSVRWRIVEGRVVERSMDGGATWTARHTATEPGLRTGAAPSADVCWIGGAAGVLLRTTDGGQTWARVEFPARTEIARILATSADAAIVTTADGRTFETTDGGKTWRER